MNLDNMSLAEIEMAIAKATLDKSAHQEKIKILSDEHKRLYREYHYIGTQLDESRRETRSQEETIREMQRQHQILVRQQIIKQEKDILLHEFKKASERYDELTASAKWREFAFDHQIEGGKRLALAKRGILGDKRGLGKTLTSIIYLDMLQAKKVAVLGVSQVIPQFIEEIQAWAPNRIVFPLHNLPAGQRSIIYPMLKDMDEFIVTLNVEGWRRDKSVVDDLIAAGVDTIILDEAHKIKASDKVTARGVFQLAFKPNKCSVCGMIANHLGPWQKEGRTYDFKPLDIEPEIRMVQMWNKMVCIGCSAPVAKIHSTVENVLTMTGTPILNKPQELFSLLYLCNPVAFPSERIFLKDYCWQRAPNRWAFKSGGLDRLQKSMSQFFIQRTREDAGITVPPPQVNIIHLDKDRENYPKQWEAERQIQEASALLFEDDRVHNILYIIEAINRARQVLTWPAGIQLKDPETKEVIARFDVRESQKLDAAVDLACDLMEEGERVVFFSMFKDPLYEGLRQITERGFHGALATGDQSQDFRDSIRQDFDLKTDLANPDRTPSYEIMFATFGAFGVSANLNGARHIIMLDDEWNGGQQDQAIGRIDRLNSTDQANIHIFRIKNSIDIFMEKLINEKRKITDGFEDTMSAADLLRGLRGEF